MTESSAGGRDQFGAGERDAAAAERDAAGAAEPDAGAAKRYAAGAAERDVASAAGPDAADVAAVTRQLGRRPRGMRAVAHRCPCGLPDVVETAPRLPDGTPFPTLYYLTCVRACAVASRLEAGGAMRQMAGRLAADSGLREAYLTAHRDYAARRESAAAAAGVPPLPPGAATAGGMPDRVKCLHALVAHELAAPGANPLGREAILAMGAWWQSGPCVDLSGS